MRLTRTALACAAATVTLGLTSPSPSPAAATAERHAPKPLRTYAADTWRSMSAMTDPVTGLPGGQDHR